MRPINWLSQLRSEVMQFGFRRRLLAPGMKLRTLPSQPCKITTLATLDSSSMQRVGRHVFSIGSDGWAEGLASDSTLPQFGHVKARRLMGLYA